ncbi:hypothetical protein [Pseudonocardia ailaonensis]|uniref:hypothetical protein n=1 Tax=Pseudonocardia ailaonensis TaxID=367279 RepID=UPI0031DDE736
MTEIDPAARIARCAPGTTIGELVEAAGERGLAVPLGTVGDDPIHLDGRDWLSRRYGTTGDNLATAAVPTDSATLADAPAGVDEIAMPVARTVPRHPAGAGEPAGLAVALTLHPVPRAVQLGIVFVGRERVAEALVRGAELIADWPDELTGGLSCRAAPSSPFVPPEYQLLSGLALVIVGLGDQRVHGAACAAAAEALDPLFRAVLPISYPALHALLGPPPDVTSRSARLQRSSLDAVAERAATRSRHDRIELFPHAGGWAAEIAGEPHWVATTAREWR